MSRTRIGRLGCSRDNQPYVVPIFFAYHLSAGGAPYLYSFTTEGQKVDWMRTNPLVCVECDEIADFNHWTSVVATGRFEELPPVPGSDANARRPFGYDVQQINHFDGNLERQRAYELLQQFTMWWQPGYASFVARGEQSAHRPYAPVYYRIHIEHVTGRRAMPR